MSVMTTAPATAPPARRRTAPEVWRAVLAEERPAPIYLEERGDEWRPVAWAEAAERVDALARGLLSRGVRRGDAVAVLSRSRVEWALLDWAVMRIGAVVVGLYPTNSPKECAYVLAHSEAVLVVVEDEEQRAKIEQVRAELPELRDVLGVDELPRLEQEGRAHPAEDLAAAEDAVTEDDLATLIYTSGTTGPPKGCMLTHRNLVVAASRVPRELGAVDDTILLFLPLAHSFGRLAHQAAAYHGATVAFVADATRVATAIEKVRPTILPAVPRVYEKVHANVLGELERAGGAKRAIGRRALDVGSRASRLQRQGRPLPLGLRMRHAIADRLVFAKVRGRLGGRLRVGVSGAAPLAVDVLEFFDALGITVVEGYGLTENASSCTVNIPGRERFGTVGQAVPGSEIRIAEDGEIFTRGETTFAGYYKDPEATRAALTEDGWLRTGDVGEIDTDGYVKITDRKKDLIITAGGKNISPQNLENALKASRFVSQALVVGDRRPYVTALITLDTAEVEATGRDPRELVQELVDEVNRERARVEQIKRFAILPRDFSQDEGEVTPTLKLKRRVVHEHFAAEIDALYG
jgi:long-chain acyl-CoA synthetase